MGLISRESIRAVSERCEIVDLVRAYVPNLKKSGARWKALCPFHEDSAPSFFVNPDRGTFKCFGCGEGGDSIAFVMKIEKIDYPEAIRMLANRVGVTLIEDNSPDADKHAEQRKRLYETNRMAMQFFEEMFKAAQGSKAREYSEKRKINPEMTSKFHLGYAPDQWDAIQKYAAGKGFRMEELVIAGLIQQREKGGYYDFFRDRLMFPIFDTQERVVGFGGRALGENPAKYINTPETPLFVKSKLLYALNFAREKARDSRHLIVVEGYTDVIMMFQHGIGEAVAPLGTALTHDHVHLMKRFADDVTTLFDGDEAGLKAAERSLDIFLEGDLPTKVVILPEAKDPCDVLVENGAEFFLAQLKNGEDVVEFKTRRALGKIDPRNIHERAEAVKLVAEVVGKIRDPIKRSMWTQSVAEKFSLPAEVLAQEIKRKHQPAFMANKTRPAEEKLFKTDPTERLFVKLLLHQPTLIPDACRFSGTQLFSTPEHLKIFTELSLFSTETEKFDLSCLLAALTTEDERRYVSLLADEDPEWKSPDAVYKDCLSRLLEKQRREAVRELKRLISAAESQGRVEDAARLLQEYQQLILQKE